MTDNRRFNGRYQRGLTVEQRFWAKVDKSGDCWLWTASLVPQTGYASFQVATGHRVNAHRWAYESLVGPLPVGRVLDHLCRVRHCVNPAHLEVVTDATNVRRGISPGARALRRSECLMGHSYNEWGVLRANRRVCRLCRAAYSRAYKTRAPGERVDLADALRRYEQELRFRLSSRPLPRVPAWHHGLPIPAIRKRAA